MSAIEVKFVRSTFLGATSRYEFLTAAGNAPVAVLAPNDLGNKVGGPTARGQRAFLGYNPADWLVF
jgi:hypothetical protein